MVLSSTLQLRILGNHSLDKMLSDDNNDSLKLHRDGAWSGVKQEGLTSTAFLEDGHDQSQASPPVASSYLQQDVIKGFRSGEWDAVQTSSSAGTTDSEVASSTPVGSDWNALSSNSFDETYLECAYTESSNGMTAATSSLPAIHHFDESISKHVAADESHEAPLFSSSSQEGTGWFLSGKTAATTGNSFALPAMEGLTLHNQTSSSAMLESSPAFCASPCTPIFKPGTASVHADKRSGEMTSCPMPCSVDAPSPVQMETFAPCVPYALEPTELLFEDMSSWTGASVESYEHHVQPMCNLSTTQTAAPSGGFFYFDNASTSVMPPGSHDYAASYQQTPSYQHPPYVSSGAASYRTTSQDSTARTEWLAPSTAHSYFPPAIKMTPVATSFLSHSSSSLPTSNHSFSSRSGSHSNQQDAAPRRVLRSSTLSRRAPRALYQSTGVLSKLTPPIDKAAQLPASSSLPGGDSAKILMLTALNDCYWKNGRKNLQCFPSCPEHHDFYSMKMNNRKHSSVGVCRGPVYCHFFTSASKLKADNGTLKGLSELFVLGRFERVPQQETTNLMEELHAPPSFDSAAAFEQFRYNCFQAVEMEERRVTLSGNQHNEEKADETNLDPDATVRSTWFFLPDVWKVQPMLKKKRKATRSAPAQTFPFCFRVLVYCRSEGGYACIADTASSFFELYSTRTVDRVKRRLVAC